MGRRELEAASLSLVKLGCLVAIMSCGLPFWRVMRFSEETSIWEGMWILCEANGLQRLKCMPYSSHLVLPLDLQVSRVLMVICIIVTWLGLLLYMIGDERIECVSNMNDTKKIKMAASGMFLGVGLLLLVPASWVTHNVILGITNPQMVFPWKPEMGASLYLGWLSSLLLLLGGALLGGAHLRCQGPSNNDQSSVFEGSNNDQTNDFEGSNNDQSSVFEGSNNDQTNDFEGFNNDQTSAFEGSNNDQTSDFEGFNNDRTSVFEGFNNDQNSAFEGFNNDSPVFLRAPGKSPPPMFIRRGASLPSLSLE